MPPWHADRHFGTFSNDSSLTQEEKDQIYAWVANGGPEGDPKKLPAPRKFPGTHMMPYEPDMIIPMADEAFDVPAEGTVEYKYFAVDPGFTEDKWVKVAECLPDNREVVHHIIVFIKPPEGAAKGIEAFGHLTGYVPARDRTCCPRGWPNSCRPARSSCSNCTTRRTARRRRIAAPSPSSSRIRRTSNGDVATIGASNAGFAIPPHADNYPVESEQKFGSEIQLLSLFPHMHLRGKAFHYEIEYPDGKKEVLLDVPHYDFNWQNSFIFKDMKTLPKGTTLHCVAHFDNSEHNLANPDPDQTVRWGDQTWEEMMIGWYDMAVPVEASLADAVPERANRRRNRDANAEKKEEAKPAAKEAAGEAE